jgi:hypothetical protein
MFRVPTPLQTASLTFILGSIVSTTHAQTPYVTYAPFYETPYGGYLHGAADVIRAQANFMVQNQQAYSMYTEDQKARIKLRRERIEQWLWERESVPTLEYDRRRYLSQQYERARFNPPLTEIWSGKSLNDLLDQAQVLRVIPDHDPPLDERFLAKINVASGKAGGNIGLLRDGKLRWPLLLLGKPFAGSREQVDRLVAEAYKQAEQRNQVDAGFLEDLSRQVDGVHYQLLDLAVTLGNRATWTPTEYIDAKNFLSQFHDALRVLQEREGVDFLTGKIKAKGKTAGELLKFMKEQGLRFAPATGDERAYKAVHSAVVEYFGHEVATRDKGER